MVIRFDQFEDNRVTWYIEPDERIYKTRDLSLMDLAECGAPLSALATRALWKLCADGLVFNSLEQANTILADVWKRMAPDSDQIRLGAPPADAVIN
jgi:hypothetical protein